VAGLRFCAYQYQYQHLPLDDLRARWRRAEERGFDVVWNCDTVVEPDRPRHFPPLTPGASVGYFEDMVGRFRDLGIDEFVLHWPRTWGPAPHEEQVFDEVTSTVLPALREPGR
jgi:hypothetical protein